MQIDNVSVVLKVLTPIYELKKDHTRESRAGVCRTIQSAFDYVYIWIMVLNPLSTGKIRVKWHKKKSYVKCKTHIFLLSATQNKSHRYITTI